MPVRSAAAHSSAATEHGQILPVAPEDGHQAAIQIGLSGHGELMDRRIDPEHRRNIARSQGGVRRRPVYLRGFRTITPANLEVTTHKFGATQAALRAAHLKYPDIGVRL